MKKRILGLDIGIGSVGWAFAELNEVYFEADEQADLGENRLKIKGGKISGMGVRTFQQPIDRNSKSLALIRGNDRRTRSTLERRSERLKYFVKLSKRYVLISNDFSASSFELQKDSVAADTDVWTLRKQGLYRLLTDFEFFRVLYHIAKHRGFYFPTKAERNLLSKDKGKIDLSEDKEDKIIKGALKKIISDFGVSGSMTIGEYFINTYPFPENKSAEWKMHRKHNKKDVYELSIPRELLLDETQKIFERQRRFGNTKASAELEEEYVKKVLMYDYLSDPENQERYTKKLHKMMGKCEFFPNEECCPKESFSSEIFSFYNRLNALKLYVSSDEKPYKFSFCNRAGMKAEDIVLKEIDRKDIFDLVLSKSKVSFADLRIAMKLDMNMRFNLCSYREKNPEYTRFVTVKRQNDGLATIADDLELYRNDTGETEGNCKEAFLQKVQKLFDKYPKMKEKRYSFSDVRNMVGLEQDLRFVFLKSHYVKQPAEMKNGLKDYLKQFEKETFFEMKGYHKIKTKFGEKFEEINTPEKIDLIAEALTKYKTDDLRKLFLDGEGFSVEQINKILELNMNGLSGFSFKALKILNPLLEKGLRFDEAKKESGLKKMQLNKQGYIPEYKGFFENNPTVARIIGQVRKVVNAVIRKYGVPDEIHIEVATDVANSKKKKALISDGQKRYKDAKERAKERCEEFGLDPYDGANLLRFRLAEEQDFKCPYTGLGIVGIPDEKNLYIKDCEIDHIIPFSRSFNDSLANKVLCAPKANQEKKNRLPFEWLNGAGNSEEWQIFKARLKTMRFSYQKRKNLLCEHFDEKDKEGYITRNLNDTRYACRHIAEYLRDNFDFSLSERKDIKDTHRVRVLGGGITASLRHMWGLDKIRGENSRHHALDAAVIACTTFGHVYYICNIKKKCEFAGKNFFKNSKIEMRPWASISEDIKKGISEIFVSRMCRHSATGEGHDGLDKKDGKYPINRSGNNKGLAKSLGNMFRFDVFKDEEGRYSVIPVYSIDLHGYKYPKTDADGNVMRDGQGSAISATKEEILRETEKNRKFVFSLYKDDYVKIWVKSETTPTEGYIVQYGGETSGQFVLKAADDSYAYQTRSTTVSNGDRILLDGKIWEIASFDPAEGCLEIRHDHMVKKLSATAKINKKGELSAKFKTEQTNTKLSKEKTVKYTEIVDLKKYQVDPLGNRIEVKSEKRLAVNSLKSNRQRRADRYRLDFHRQRLGKS